MARPLVSVIIPLFNKEKYISSTIKSVVSQDYDNLELILIDDGSTDNSFDIAKRMLSLNEGRFKRMVLLSRENWGMTKTKNQGISLAYGVYVAFLDADDLWLHSKVSKQVDFLEDNPEIQLVLCNHVMLYSRKSKSKCVSYNSINRKVKNWLMMTGYGGLLESTGMARKSVLDKIGGFNPHLEMWAALDLAFSNSINNSIGCVPEYLCGYRVLPGGWHNNKQDLVESFSYLSSNLPIYEPYVDEIRVNLETYLRLWRVRNEKNLVALRLFIVWLGKHPVWVIKFLVLTLARVYSAQIRTLVNRRIINNLYDLELR